MNKKELALQYHAMGYNCAQSTILPFCEELGFDKETMFKVSEAFGLGMGTMGTCGAVSAIAMAVGMAGSDGNLDAPATKAASYGMMKENTKKFLDKNQSVICKEIKGVETGKVLRSCNGCIEDAVEIIEEMLQEMK